MSLETPLFGFHRRKLWKSLNSHIPSQAVAPRPAACPFNVDLIPSLFVPWPFVKPPKLVNFFHNWSPPLLPSVLIQSCPKPVLYPNWNVILSLAQKPPSSDYLSGAGCSPNLAGTTSPALPSLFPTHCSLGDCRVSPQPHPHPDLTAFVSLRLFPRKLFLILSLTVSGLCYKPFYEVGTP